MTPDGWVGLGIINDGRVFGVIDDCGAVSGLGNTYLTEKSRWKCLEVGAMRALEGSESLSELQLGFPKQTTTPSWTRELFCYKYPINLSRH